MFSRLTLKQKEIVDCLEPRIVVKACPGSGKTYSVSARLANLILNKSFKHSGIAVISFTNTAGNEIKKSLFENYNIQNIGYPHFLGTIDSFVNKHIFLPFGHLIMGCKSRPEVVGTEFNQWYDYDSSMRSGYSQKITDPNFYFDKVSFDKNDDLLRLLPYNSYYFGKAVWDNMFKANNEYKKQISDLIECKEKYFKEGKANQADANYISLKLLKKYPFILESLARKYSHLIIDEAQDTTDIQMEIIELLDGAQQENIIFIGDPDQAIFEWNTADAELFLKKYNNQNYFNIELNENRRSSTKICSVLNKMVGSTTASIADVKDDVNQPAVKGYDTNDKNSVQLIKNEFLEKCTELGISHKKSAILFRGKSFGEEHFELAIDNSDDNPWVSKHYHVKDIVHGKYLMEKGEFRKSLKLLERSYYKCLNPDLRYVSKVFLLNEIEQKGFREYRKKMFEFINLLPTTNSKTLKEWIIETNSVIIDKGFNQLLVKINKSNFLIKELFHKVETSDLLFNLGTIHSVKGQTFDATLLFLKKKAIKNYSTVLANNYNEPDETKRRKDKEELRLVYVACSRPKRLLWLAVPNDDIDIWKDYMGLNLIVSLPLSSAPPNLFSP
ncbi:ATP-dependent helicase [Lacinutrix himadriensis]|uniref:ATP-dependent helicase n=1 Tax=Lacinutrix himadriensis TaxID=641549 RepID=UPI0009F90E6F|nr:ATP-dependent helicase [Lacinutrix himadriensis]